MQPLLFVLPMKSVFESALLLLADLKAGRLPATRRAVLNTLVTGLPHTHEEPEGGAVQRLADTPMRRFDAKALANSEAILGHKCNADQEQAVRQLPTGLAAIHGPPGTGAHARPGWHLGFGRFHGMNMSRMHSASRQNERTECSAQAPSRCAENVFRRCCQVFSAADHRDTIMCAASVCLL